MCLRFFKVSFSTRTVVKSRRFQVYSLRIITNSYICNYVIPKYPTWKITIWLDEEDELKRDRYLRAVFNYIEKHTGENENEIKNALSDAGICSELTVRRKN